MVIKFALEAALFALFETEDKRQELQVHPNFMQGIDVRTMNGDIQYSINPGVSTEGAALVDGSGEKIATIRESVHGRTVYDFGGGETAVSSPTLDGSVVQDISGKTIGFTEPAFQGGVELQNSVHEKIVEMNRTGSEIYTQIPMEHDFTTIISGNTFDQSSSLYDTYDVADSLDSASDAMDIADFLGDLL